MTPPSTPTKEQTDTATDQARTRAWPSSSSPRGHRGPSGPRRYVQLAAWAGIAVALAAAIAVLVAGMSDDGLAPDPTGVAATDAPAGDPVLGRQIFVEDLRSVGPPDPEVGREIFMEDLRSVGRVDPEIGREIFVEDLRSVGR